MERIKPKEPHPSDRGRLLPFGPPPLIWGESAADYDEFLAHISSAVKPADSLEDIWVRDVVDLVWEVRRLRRLKATLLNAEAWKKLEESLGPLMGEDDAYDLAQSWAAGDSKAVRQVDKLIVSGALSMDAVMARTLSANLDDVERIDRMIMNMEGRRYAALREMDRHREALGEQLRWAAQYAEDADFEEVPPKSIAHRGSAA
jgi:hypothetical protein